MLVRRTRLFRATVNQEARIIVEAEADLPANVVRHVQLLVPASPTVVAAIDKLPSDVGADRSYKLAELPGSQPVCFRLQHGQFVIAACSAAFAELSVIVEYEEGA